MLAAGTGVALTPLIESHVLFPALLESMASCQSVCLPVAPGPHPVVTMLQGLHLQNVGQMTLGANPEFDEYLEQLIQLQHSQRMEMQRLFNLADDFSQAFTTRVRGIRLLGPQLKAKSKNSAAVSTTTPTSAPPAAAASSSPPTLAPATVDEGEGHVEDYITRTTDGKGQRKKRSNLPRFATQLLRRWIAENKEHPYPSDEAKKMLCEQTGLTLTQLNNWFINSRRRFLVQLNNQNNSETPSSPAVPAPLVATTAVGAVPPAAAATAAAPTAANPASNKRQQVVGELVFVNENENNNDGEEGFDEEEPPKKISKQLRPRSAGKEGYL